MIEFNIHTMLDSPAGTMTLHVDISIRQGAFVTLYGDSGAGKTSLLNILAGLLTPDTGRIAVDGAIWFDSAKEINLTPQKRNVGYMFQEYALFPNMTIRENLLFALPKGQDATIVEELIDIAELGDLQRRKPATLSGGQKQRVALARALAQRPRILLLDEPLAALDSTIRAKLQQYIIHVHREYKLTTIMVSHDISEILKMSDMMLIMEHGAVIHQGPPAETLSHKEVSGKFQFIGEVIALERQDVIYLVSVLIGKDLVKVVADDSEANSLNIGDKVLVASKAFNPIIKKIA